MLPVDESAIIRGLFDLLNRQRAPSPVHGIFEEWIEDRLHPPNVVRGNTGLPAAKIWRDDRFAASSQVGIRANVTGRCPPSSKGYLMRLTELLQRARSCPQALPVKTHDQRRWSITARRRLLITFLHTNKIGREDGRDHLCASSRPVAGDELRKVQYGLHCRRQRRQAVRPSTGMGSSTGRSINKTPFGS